MDLGTGDGRAVLAEARADPEAYVFGIDADARAMADASRRAARTASSGGLPNAVFVTSGVELLPAELDGLADRVTVRFPWGSLLRGALGLDPAVAGSIARLVKRGGLLELIISIVERDGVASMATFAPADLTRIESMFGALGLDLASASEMTTAEIRATGSTWARRLRAGGTARPAWRIVLRRRASAMG